MQTSGTTISGGSSNCTYIVHKTSNWAKVCEGQGSVSCTNLSAGEHRVTAYTSSPWAKVEDYRVTLTAASTSDNSSSPTLTSNSVCAAPQKSGTAVTGGSNNCTYVIHDTSNWAKVCQQVGPINCTGLDEGEHRINVYQRSPWKRVDQHFVTITTANQPANTTTSDNSNDSTLTSSSVCAAPQKSGTAITGGSNNCTYVIHNTSNWAKVCQQYGPINCTGLDEGEHRINVYQNNPWKRVDQHFVTITATTSAFSQIVPTITEASYNGTYVGLKWNRLSGHKGVNIYRNNQFVTSINSGNVFNDYEGMGRDVYYIVAYSQSNELTQKSATTQALQVGEVSGVSNLQAVESGVRVKLTWKATSTAVGEWEIYRGSELWKTVPANTTNPNATYTVYDSNQFVELAPSYSVRAVGRTFIKGQLSQVASPLPTMRHFDLDVATHVGTTAIAWESTGRFDTGYTIRRFEASTGQELGKWTTEESSFTIQKTGRSNDVYVVTQESGDTIYAQSSVVRADGTCESDCSQDETNVIYIPPSLPDEPGLGYVDTSPNPAKLAGWVAKIGVMIGKATGKKVIEAMEPEYLPGGNQGATVITEGNTTTTINETTGERTAVTILADGSQVVITTSTPTRFQMVNDPTRCTATNCEQVAQALPDSPMRNVTTLYVGGVVIDTVTTVTKPNGDTYVEDRNPPGGGGDGDGGFEVNSPGNNWGWGWQDCGEFC